jgi:pyrophosphatase PpaX
MRHYQAVLFDMDGVLADTREWVVSAFTHTARTHSLDFSYDALHPLFGQPLEVCYDCLAPGGRSALLADTHRAFQQHHPHLVTAFDQIHDVLRRLQFARITMAIVTGRTHHSADLALERLALHSFFSAVVCADDTQMHKPHPQPVLRALSLLSVTSAETLVVGDAASDILSGQRAGCDTAGALYGFVGPALAATEPTYLLQTPRDLLPILGLADQCGDPERAV